jgi:hypothetical protein
VPARTIQFFFLRHFDDYASISASASFCLMVHTCDMRTTITLDDDTHEFVAHYASARGLSLGAAVDELIRRARTAPPAAPDIRRSASGLPMFPPTGRTITSEVVKGLEEEEFDPEKSA